VSPTFEVNLANIYNSKAFGEKREFMKNFTHGEVKYP
jgi:hypothetical protein